MFENHFISYKCLFWSAHVENTFENHDVFLQKIDITSFDDDDADDDD